MIEKDETVKLNDTQPAPKKNNYPPAWDLVMADMRARDELGEKKYKTRLQPLNGRNSVKDAYEEALDMVVYLKQLQFEKDIIIDFLKDIAKSPSADMTNISYEAHVLLEELGEL